MFTTENLSHLTSDQPGRWEGATAAWVDTLGMEGTSAQTMYSPAKTAQSRHSRPRSEQGR